MAETAGMLGVDRVFIGTSRQGALYQLIKGDFHQRLEALLPSEIKVEVIPINTAYDQAAETGSR